MQNVAPSPEQQWETMLNRLAERANGIPDTRALKIDIQEGLLFLQRLKDQLIANKVEELQVWKDRADKAEAGLKEAQTRTKELEAKYEFQPKEKTPGKTEQKPNAPEGEQK